MKRNTAIGAAWVLVLLGALIIQPAGAGVLDALRIDVRDGDDSDDDSSRDDDRKHRHGHDDDDGSPWLGLLVSMFASDDDHHHHCHGHHSGCGCPSCGGGSSVSVGVVQQAATPDARFARFPYAGVPGYMVTEPWPDGPSIVQQYDEATDPLATDVPPPVYPMQGRAFLRDWSGRLRCDWGGNLDDLDRLGGHLLLTSSSRWGLETEFLRFEERLGGGAYNLLLRLVETEHTILRVGVGFNWLDDRFDTNFGYNFTAGIDWFPVQPYVISSTLDWGSLGGSELFHFRTTAGVIVNRFEFYTGYEYYDIGNTQLNALVGGVRVWF